MHAKTVMVSCAMVLGACVTAPAGDTEAGAPAPGFCASTEDAAAVGEFMTKRPGIPLAIPSRNLEIPEAVVASALSTEDAVGVMATPEVAAQVWDSIEAWGESSKVGLVFSPSGQHAFALPSLVPVRVDPDDDGYLDVYADDGAGVHSHIQLKYVSAIYATDLSSESGDRTRGVTYFGPDGHAIIGVYASIKSDVYSEGAATGFEETWNLLAELPQPCE